MSAIIAAISQEPDFQGFDDLHSGKDWIKAGDFGATSVDGVYAGGDDTALGLVTIAIAQGRFAAEAIDARFRGVPLEKPAAPVLIEKDKVHLDWYKAAPRHERQQVAVAEREPDTEVELGLTRSRRGRRGQALHVLRHVHGLRELLDVLQQQLLRAPAQRRTLQSETGVV